MNIKDVIGHERILEYMQRAIESGKISHAYLLIGEPGSGKRMLANLFAKTIQCESGKAESCNECKSCKQADSGNHPDIRVLKHEKSSISVDDIREQINEDVSIKPYSGRKKIYIIDEAEKMTEAAQNALLKTLEEPPEYVTIFILSETREAMLQTILSRTVTFELRPVSLDRIKKYLMMNCGIPDYQAEMAAAFSGGVVGKAIRYATSEDFADAKEKIIKAERSLKGAKSWQVVEKVKTMGIKKEDAGMMLDLFELWYRDVIIYKSMKDKDRLAFRNELPEIKEIAEISTYEDLYNIIDMIGKTRARLKANVALDVSMELLLSEMAVD